MRLRSTVLITSICITLASALGAAPGVQEADARNAAEMETARQRELAQIAEVLRNPSAQGYAGAVHRLIHIASRYPQMPADVQSLLVLATSSPDRELADFAERALYAFGHRREPEPGVSEEALYRQAQRGDLEQAREALAGAGSGSDTGSRLAAVHTLVHLLTTATPEVTEEAAELLVGVKQDWQLRTTVPESGGRLGQSLDFSLAALAERALAAREGRPVDAAFVPDGYDSGRDSSPVAVDPDTFAMLADQSPARRLLAMEILIERAQNDALSGSDRERTIAAFEILTDDSDPRVAGRARFVLAGFAGDENGWANVYVGVVKSEDGAGSQP